MSDQPGPSSISRTAAQSPAARCRSASGKSTCSSMESRSSSRSSSRVPVSTTNATASRAIVRRRRRKRRELRLLLPAKTLFHLRKPADQALDETAGCGPPLPRRPASAALELGAETGAEPAHHDCLTTQRVHGMSARELGADRIGGHPGSNLHAPVRGASGFVDRRGQHTVEGPRLRKVQAGGDVVQVAGELHQGAAGLQNARRSRATPRGASHPRRPGSESRRRQAPRR